MSQYTYTVWEKCEGKESNTLGMASSKACNLAVLHQKTVAIRFEFAATTRWLTNLTAVDHSWY